MIEPKDILINMMTPGFILNKTEHDKPAIIFSEDFKSFTDLYIHKELIRNLELVPIKSDEMYKKYHDTKKEELINSINFGINNIIFLKNQFPYILPNDVEQNLIWIKKGTTQSEYYILFITK